MSSATAEGVLGGFGQYLDHDPYLEYQPAFAYTLPIQIFVNGITLTLLAVLLMHLLFTTQYHYPLAPLNYCLQLSSMIVVFISVIVKSWLVLHYAAKEADTWPYGLDYVAFSIPPQSWSMGQDAAWFLLQALNNGLSNITHIQFLTLLYPSPSEARLIILVLGPLAITSSGLVFTALSGSQRVLDISDSIRNILNSTLLLIFTVALIIWGLFVNRRRAWRTDGGTAVFGTGSLLLAVVTTTMNFIAVAEDGIDWLQHLLFAAVLWQIWLGWWWWVGSGMGIGEVEDMLERAERKKRKAARRAARQRAAERATERGERIPLRHRASSFAGLAEAGHASATAVAASVTSILRNRNSTLARRNTARSQRESNRVADEEEGTMGGSGSGIELEVIRPGRIPTPAVSSSGSNGNAAPSSNGHVGPTSPMRESRVGFSTPPDSRSGAVQQSTNSETSSTSATPSLHPPKTLGQVLAYPTTWLHVYMRRLRHAHEDAARKMALEREERRRGVFETRRDRPRESREEVRAEEAPREAAISADEGIGWGLGSFGIKEHRESAKRLQAARERLDDERLIPMSTPEMDEPPESQPHSRRGSAPPAEIGDAGPSTQRNRAARLENEETMPKDNGKGKKKAKDSDWEDVTEESGTDSSAGARRRFQIARNDGGTQPRQGGGWSWWGPLKDWRLNDRSSF